MNPKILFLYTEIAEYVLSGIEELIKKNVEVHIVRWPVNEEAPFMFRSIDNGKFYNRKNFNSNELLNLAVKINPDIIISSGWIDKAYLNICKYFFRNKITVLTLDNHWTGSLKQQIARLISPFYFKKIFSHAWVPGKPQVLYAQKLGFDKNKIYTGFYSADTKLYSNYYSRYKEFKKNKYPHNILYTGRYISSKSVDLLWDAFLELQEENENDYNLYCIGTGELYEKRKIHPKIKHFGFVQPKDMGKIISETGIFILPSKFEPWGVVVHEFAAAGYPLICSDKVGAASEFLENKQNGYIFQSENKESLKSALKKIMNLSDSELVAMGEKSRKKSQLLSPEIWADTVLKILNS